MVSNFQTSNHPRQAWLPDGTEVRLVPPERTKFRPLYISADGRPFSHVRVKDKRTGDYRFEFHLLRPIFDTSKTNKYNGNRKQKYFKMTRTYGYILIHYAVALAFIGQRPGESSVVDHLNGITTDNRIENLQWVTRKENEKRAKLLRELRRIGRDPAHMTREELLAIFASCDIVSPDTLMLREMSRHAEM